MSKEKHQWPEFLWVQFPSILMEIVDLKPISVLHPPILPTHITLSWNCEVWINYWERTISVCYWSVCILICKQLFLLRNVEKVMITVQAPNYADKWFISIGHDNEVTMYHMIAVFNIKLFRQVVTLHLFCVDPSWSGLTVEAEIAPWRFQPKSQPSLIFQHNSFSPLVLL